MAAKCRYCSRPAIFVSRQARAALCEEHFRAFIEKRVEATLQRVGMLRKGIKVLAAVSGGKDSSTMAAILAKLARKYGFSLYMLHINLGFGAYSEKSEHASKQLCKRLGVHCIILKIKDILGEPVHVVARRARRSTCSLCGLVKRYILNAAAVELGADYVALGHNADDIIAYSIKTLLLQELGGLAKFGPATRSLGDIAVGRVRPLYEVSEKEALVYALAANLPFIHEECPHRPAEPLEEAFKHAVNLAEEAHPGVKVMAIRNIEKNAKMVEDEMVGGAGYGKCRWCGLLAAGDECSFCRITKRLYGEPKGPAVRRALASLLKALTER
jgi:uncharacterized protein (TIGR00269 family)